MKKAIYGRDDIRNEQTIPIKSTTKTATDKDNILTSFTILRVPAEMKQQQRDESGFHALFLMLLFLNSLLDNVGENCHGWQF